MNKTLRLGGVNSQIGTNNPAQGDALPELPFEKWLSAKEIAAHFGVDDDTVLRWWHQGLPTGRDIPRPFMRRRGFRDLLFHPHLVAWLKAEQDRLD